MLQMGSFCILCINLCSICAYSFVLFRYLDNKVFVSLANGDVIVYQREAGKHKLWMFGWNGVENHIFKRIALLYLNTAGLKAGLNCERLLKPDFKKTSNCLNTFCILCPKSERL